MTYIEMLEPKAVDWSQKVIQQRPSFAIYFRCRTAIWQSIAHRRTDDVSKKGSMMIMTLYCE